MIVIRTAAEMACALASPLPSTLRALLQAHWDRLSGYQDYSLSELALFIIVEPPDSLPEIEIACGRRLRTAAGKLAFSVTPEIVQQRGEWAELTFILSDDGFGLVLLVPLATTIDPMLQAVLDHCLAHLGCDASE